MKQKNGFTLIEMTVVIVIIGLITAGIFSVLHVQLKQTRADLTEKRMERIVEAIRYYEKVNGKLPWR